MLDSMAQRGPLIQEAPGDINPGWELGAFRQERAAAKLVRYRGYVRLGSALFERVGFFQLYRACVHVPIDWNRIAAFLKQYK